MVAALPSIVTGHNSRRGAGEGEGEDEDEGPGSTCVEEEGDSDEDEGYEVSGRAASPLLEQVRSGQTGPCCHLDSFSSFL